MATFGDWKKLPSLSTKSGQPCVKYVASKDILLCTTGLKHVDLCSPQDGRSKQTWSVRESDQLTTPAVYDPIQEDFVIVVNHNTLYKWRETTMDIMKGRKNQLDSKVHTLVQCEKQEPLLLFEDGRISRCSAPGDSLCDPLDAQIVWSDGIKQKKKCVLCTVVKNGEQLEAFVYMIEKNTQSVQPQKILLEGEGSRNFCLQQTDGHVCLLSLSVSGDMDKYTLTGLSFGEHEKITVAAKVGKDALLCALDDSHFVITETKQTKDDDVGLATLDLRFNTVKAWSAYPHGTKAAPVYLCVVKDNLFLGVSSGVHQCQYSVAISTLGSVLGKLAATGHKPVESSTALQTLIAPLLDRSKTKDYKSFQKAFDQFSKALKEKPNESVLVQQQINSLVKRCLEEKHFFPEKELLYLVSQSLVPANFCMDTLKKLKGNGNVAGIHSCLIHIKDIPESVIVQCLQFFLDLDTAQFPNVSDEEMSSEEDEDGETSECPFPKKKAAYVNRVLMIPFNDVFLLDSLKKLEFTKCVELLGYLRYLLATLPQEANKKNNNWAEFSYEKVVTWLGLILDAHFTQMIVSPDAGRVLVNIQEVVESQMSYFDGLRELENMIQHFLKSVQTPTKQRNSDYCIEKLIMI